MISHALRILGLSVLVVAGAFGLVWYQNHYAYERRIQALEEQRRELEQFVERLGAERRVADLLVTDQSHRPDGQVRTNLLFVEYDRNGNPLPPKSFTIEGTMAHLDAKVIKFEDDFVKENDPLKGHSLALFTRMYGDLQAPEDGSRIDVPGQVPDVYRGSDPRVSRFEQELWENFWRLLDEPAYREQHGVRIAQGEGVWWPPEPGKLYTVTVEADGGLNLTWEPVKGIFQEALRSATTRPAETSEVR